MNKEKFTVNAFIESKEKGRKISVLTAYDYSMAKILDEAGVDVLLVGDSLGMVVQGYETTLEVTVDDMLYHCRGVSKGTKSAFVVGDMPFMSYHVNVEEAVRNAGRFIKEGHVNAVKLEGGRQMIPQITGIINAQIPVMGHLGLTPQSVNMFGGFKVQGKLEAEAKAIIEDALALEEAGVFAIVLEAIPRPLAKIISEKLTIPTIGIGAGEACDGQVLVINDMLGMFSDFTPKFVKKYANLKVDIDEAVKAYISDVQEGSFPEEKHCFSMKEEIIEKLY